MANISKGMLHRAFSVFLFNPEGKLLLQQRSEKKITFPNLFTNTCCSHPLYTPAELEEAEAIGVKKAAQRQLQYELGISPQEVPLENLNFMTRIQYQSASNETWGEHELDSILLAQCAVHPKLNINEVKCIRYVDSCELKDLLKNKKSLGLEFTPWFQLIVGNFLDSWWEQLKSFKGDNAAWFKQISKQKDRARIHRM
jgi:isopentenyl-diphosphate delta-isomerase